MPLPGHGRSALEVTNGRPLCPQCRVPLWLVYIDERDSNDRRYFECHVAGTLIPIVALLK